MATSIAKFVVLLTMGACVLAGVGGSSTAWAENSSLNIEDANQIKSVDIGFGKQVVLGHWVPIAIEFSSLTSNVNSIEVSIADGSGMAHGYVYPADTSNNRTTIYVRFGRSNSDVVIKLLDANKNILASQLVGNATIKETHTFHPAVRPLILNLGSDLNLGKNLGFDRNRDKQSDDLEAVHVSEFALLPDTAVGYDSIETIVLTSFNDGQRFLEQMSSPQIQALVDWVKLGGHMVVSSGVNSSRFFGPGQPFESLTTSPIADPVAIQNAGRLESYVDSQNKLLKNDDPPILAAGSSGEGSVILLRDKNGPLISKRAIGFGVLTFVSIDLDDERLMAWKEYGRLLSKIIKNEIRDESSSRNDNQSGRVTHIGFEDISGQLRSSLDQFENVRMVNFTIVAVLTGLFILLIGPADYFLVSRLFKRMEWTWISFSLITIAFCGLAVWLNSITKPGTSQLNQVEVVDIDETTKTIRGIVWSHFYSPASTTHDFNLRVDQPGVVGETGEWFSWHGLPGTGLGGMQTENMSRGSGYVCKVARKGQQLDSTIQGFPVRNASTSSFKGHWNGSTSINPSSRLFQNKNGTDLNGTFSNPMAIPLTDAVIFHGETAYEFRRPLKAGEPMTVESDTDRSSIRAYFMNQKGMAHGARRQWDVNSFDLKRIVEMMMFFDSIEGESYTTMSHEFDDEIDMSDLLGLDRAILFGRVKKAVNTIEMDGTSTAEFRDQQWTFIRIVMPVSTR